VQSLASLLARARALFRRRRDREEFDEELRFHLEMEVGHLLARGASPADARRDALRAFGGVERFREEARDARGGVLIDELAQNIRMAIRRLRRTPMFTAAATVTLAVAIGATTSVFGVVDGILLKPFPLRDPDRVVVILLDNSERQLLHFTLSPPDFLDYRDQNRTFTALAAMEQAHFTVTAPTGAERVSASLVTPNFFSVAGISPMLGRALAADSAGPAEVVIGYGYWKRRFGGAPSALGRTIVLDNRAHTIVGVMPAGLPGDVELWTRLSLEPSELIHRDWHYLTVFGRLKTGVTPDEGRRDLETITGRLARAYPQTNRGWSIVTVPLVDFFVGTVRPALIMLLCAAACVLLIGAANLANLFLVRCLARERELAVRAALGATRGRLVRELLVEAAILGSTASAMGVGVAIAGVQLLRALAPAILPRLSEVGVDGRVLVFCLVASFITVLMFGAVPAWLSSRQHPADAIKQGGRGTHSRRHHRLQDALVVLQVAIALVLLTGSGLMVETFERFRHMDLGFRTDGVLTASVALPEQHYGTPDREGVFASNMVERLAALPGVDAAAVSSALPGTAWVRWAYTIVGDPKSDYDHAPTVRPVFVTSEYFRTMGIALRRGRGIRASDDRNAVRIAVVDERFARQIFGGRDPIGVRLAPTNGPDPDTVEVVGVVAPVKQGGLIPEDLPWIYKSIAQAPMLGSVRDVVVHTAGDAETQMNALKRAMTELDGSVPVYDIKSMNAAVAQSVSMTRFSTFLASLFAVVALILGIVGIYSVLAYVATEREWEIAIRLALGASRANVVSDVIRRAFTLSVIGIVLGSGAAWWLTRTLAGMFGTVSPHDPRVFIGAAIAFVVVSLIAAAVPARRTARVSPLRALTTT
jgi:predicted permease